MQLTAFESSLRNISHTATPLSPSESSIDDIIIFTAIKNQVSSVSGIVVTVQTHRRWHPTCIEASREKISDDIDENEAGDRGPTTTMVKVSVTIAKQNERTHYEDMSSLPHQHRCEILEKSILWARDPAGSN